jgi:outer membrane protein TolC
MAKMKQLHQLVWPGVALVLLLAGCRGIQTAGEKSARRDLAHVGGQLQTNLPVLSTNSTLRDAVLLAVRNHPQVFAAYADWAASVESITVARSLPDPQLTFELYADDAVRSLMPGLMTEFPGPTKLRARAAEASAESRAKYFQFESAVQQAAFAVEKSFYPLHFLDAKLSVNRQMLALLDSLEVLARTQNEVGRATLQDVLQAQIEQEKLRTQTANLEDSRHVLMAQFKAALGLSANQPDPAVPAPVFTQTSLNDEELLVLALKQNPRLKELEAEIRVADAAIRVAQKDKIPDFTAGFEVDVKPNPFIWNPQFSMTLPIWRDKLKAEVVAAQNGKRAAMARLTAGQINLVADFAEKSYIVREANRELKLLRERLLPRARQSLEVSRAAYRSGQVGFLNVIDAERSLLGFQLDEIAAQTQREITLAELRLMIAGTPPKNAPGLQADNSTPAR